jgi:hypothetical protein
MSVTVKTAWPTDTESVCWTITSDGTSLFSEDNEAGVELWIDGIAQQTDSVSVGQAVFTVTDMNGLVTESMKLLSTEGYSNTSSEETMG